MLSPPVKCAAESLTLIAPTASVILTFANNPAKKNIATAGFFIIGHFVDCTIRNYANIITEEEPEYKSSILNTIVPFSGAFKYKIINFLQGKESTYHTLAVGSLRSILYHHYRNTIKELSDNDETVEFLSFYAPIPIEITCIMLANPTILSLKQGLAAGLTVTYAMPEVYKPILDYLETTSFGGYDPDSSPIVENSVYLIEQFEQFTTGSLTET